MASDTATEPLAKPLAGLLFLLFWAGAIVAWSLSHTVQNPHAGAFVVDAGIVLACLGFAALFLPTVGSLRSAIIVGLVGLAFFAIGDFGQVQVITYTLRILGPLLALFTPVNNLVKELF
ncbi:MAG: hypothetical protein JWO10_1304 [Microbacteriaceae bacterium]|nr:hypothetical protein [Microbacteriaceae bacterium]